MVRRKSRTPAVSDLPEQPTVVVCRGGDCGNPRKHPGFDHAGQLARIRGALKHQAVVLASPCLDACEHSNVIVVLPDSEARTSGEQPTWVGDALDGDTTEDIVTWVQQGGPGHAEPLSLIEINAFRPTRLSRQELDELGERIASTARR